MAKVKSTMISPVEILSVTKPCNFMTLMGSMYGISIYLHLVDFYAGKYTSPMDGWGHIMQS